MSEAGAELSGLDRPSLDRPGFDLPEAVRSLALRCGAREDEPGRAVLLSQTGFMRNAAEDRPIHFTARETIQLGATEFLWTAGCEPMNLLTVKDELHGEEGKLSLLAFGAVPLFPAIGGLQATRGETMRYLAELPWAPDAILHNRELSWHALDSRTLLVSAGKGDLYSRVVLKLGDDGLVCAVRAEGRPRREGRRFVERSWRGRFSAYQERHGRVVPGRGEVGWVVEGSSFDCWVGELQDWRIQ
ncbi:MAG: DUF6544 family protein [Caulobacteraceae bacterium]